MATFPSKVNYATGDVLTATNMNDIGGAINLLEGAQYAAGVNRVLNGNFSVWQRGAGSFTTEGYTADRWRMALSGATASVTRQSFTVGQTDVPGNPNYFFRLAVTTGDNACRAENYIEDATTFAGQIITISFYAKGTNPSLGNLEVILRQEFGGGGSAAVSTTAGTIVLTSSWQRFTKTITVPSVSGKTIGTNSSIVLDIRQPAADTGTAAWTLDLANVQIEVGSTASPFQTATGTLSGELAACQRYYFRSSANASNSYAVMAPSGYMSSTTSGTVNVVFPVSMRIAPTSVDFSGLGTQNTLGAIGSVSAITLTDQSTTQMAGIVVTTGVQTANLFIRLLSNGSSTGYLALSAE